MSYDYFLQAYVEREPQQVETGRVLEIFKDYIVERFPDGVELKFDEENSCTVYIDAEEQYIDGMMVNRPCEGKLGECLYEVMKLGNFVFFEPDGNHVIILHADVVDHLPEDMVDGLGGAVVGETMDEFLKLYVNNRD